MTQRVYSSLVAGYLLLCILLGGSAQGLWTNLALQNLGIALIAWVAIRADTEESRAESSKTPLVLLGLGALVILLQLIPLPPTLLDSMHQGRTTEAGPSLITDVLPVMPISKAPYQSVLTLFTVIPGLALFAAVTKIRLSAQWLAWAIVAATVCGIALSAVQVATGGAGWTRLYPIMNEGAGVFANRNHLATLLLVSIPFASALLVSSTREGGGSAQGRWLLGTAALLLVVVGIVLSNSLAAIGLGIPVVLASAALSPAVRRWRGVALAGAGASLLAGLVLLTTTSVGGTVGLGTEASVSSRQEIWSTTFKAVRQSFPAGTGLGTFVQVYRQYEDPTVVTRQYVNHAHNDYLELVLELGAPGLLLIVAFMVWYVIACVKTWTSHLSNPFRRAATIASATILAHSAVDYPLRTAGIAAIFGMAIALVAQRPVRTRVEDATSKHPRHVRIG